MSYAVGNARPRLDLSSAPVLLPVTAKDARKQCRIDVTTEDALLERYIKAATAAAEKHTRRRLITQTWDLYWDSFPPSGERLCVTYPPVKSITSITYLDGSGVSTTWSSALYSTFLPSGDNAQAGLVEPVFGETWPTTQSGTLNAVKVIAVFGYASEADVPADITSGILLMVSHFNENREGTTGAGLKELPLGVSDLWDPYTAEF